MREVKVIEKTSLKQYAIQWILLIGTGLNIPLKDRICLLISSGTVKMPTFDKVELYSLSP